jgi:hypothetical protein
MRALDLLGGRLSHACCINMSLDGPAAQIAREPEQTSPGKCHPILDHSTEPLASMASSA